MIIYNVRWKQENQVNNESIVHSLKNPDSFIKTHTEFRTNNYEYTLDIRIETSQTTSKPLTSGALFVSKVDTDKTELTKRRRSKI